jgi:hypothetical protein
MVPGLICANSPHSPIDRRRTAPRLDKLADAWPNSPQPSDLGDFGMWLPSGTSISDEVFPKKAVPFPLGSRTTFDSTFRRCQTASKRCRRPTIGELSRHRFQGPCPAELAARRDVDTAWWGLVVMRDDGVRDPLPGREGAQRRPDLVVPYPVIKPINRSTRRKSRRNRSS